MLHTSVCEKPCLRKMQTGPTMLCSMLQFFISVEKGSSYGLSSASSSSSSPSWPTALTLPPRGPSFTTLEADHDVTPPLIHCFTLKNYNHTFQGTRLRPTAFLVTHSEPRLHKLLIILRQSTHVLNNVVSFLVTTIEGNILYSSV